MDAIVVQPEQDEPTKIPIETSDKEMFVVDYDVIKQSTTIRTMLQGTVSQFS